MKKVLIGEDSSITIKLTEKILERQDYKVTGAKNGQEVLDLFEKEDFHIVLLDIHMPVMSGITCAQEIRKHPSPKKRNVPIILITGDNVNYKEEDFKQYGITDCLFKPLNYDELIGKILRHSSQ